MKYIDLTDRIYNDEEVMSSVWDVKEILDWLDEHPEQLAGRTITESSDRYVFDGASALAVEFGRVVESDDGYLQPHPVFPDRHTITAMLKDGDHLPTIGAKDRITVIIEKADPKPTNAELLEALLEGGDINAQWGLRGGGVMFARELAHALDKAGVRMVTESE